MKPVWKLTAGAAVLTPESPGEAAAGFAVTADLGMGCWAGGFTLRLAPDHGLPLDVGAEAALELGGAGLSAPVARGRVAAVHRHLDHVEIAVTTDAAKLLRLRPVRTYRGQRAGLIVQDLARLAGVAPGAIEPGADLPFYAMDGSRSAFQQIHDLALASGCDVWFTPTGQLQFARWAGAGQPVAFTYGEEILALSSDRAPAAPAGAVVIGEGAAASQGAARWHWLDKEPVKGSAGEGGEQALQLSNAALRSPEAAAALARSVVALAGRRALSGTIRVLGTGAVAVGGAIAITKTPNGALDGIYQVRRVRHELSPATGFVTEIDFIKAG